jgi:ribose transport system substrate-binding protein
MKKYLSIVLVLAMVMVFAVSCTSKTGETSTGGGKGVVYYMAPTLFDEFQAGSNDMETEFAKEFGYELKALNANNNAQKQMNQMADAITKKPQAIILNAVDSSTIVSSVEDARKAGIPVLVYDRFIQTTKLDFHSVVGTIKMGNIGAEECLKVLKAKYGSEKGKILEIMGDPGDQYTVLIDQGFQDTLKQYPDIKVVAKDTAGWEPTIGANILSDQLTAAKDIDIVFCHSDGRATALIPVLEENKLNKGDIYIIGTDGAGSGLDLIRQGWMQETVAVPMVEQVKAIWTFMGKVIAKEELKAGSYDIDKIKAEMVIESWGPTLYLPGQIINKDNVDNPALWGNLKVTVTKD